MATVEYTVTGMTCGNCEKHIREEVEQIEGVTSVEVSAATGRLVVSASGDPLHDDAIFAAVEEAGYSAARA